MDVFSLLDWSAWWKRSRIQLSLVAFYSSGRGVGGGGVGLTWQPAPLYRSRCYFER